MATGRILVVDDEPAVLEFVVRVLERAGYDVVSAQGPPEALGIVKAGAALDLVVSDVVMPGLQGPQLIREIARISPLTPFVLISGCVPERSVPAGIPFIAKPFSSRDLLNTVDKVIQQSSAAREDLNRAREESEALRARCAENRLDAAEVERLARRSVRQAQDALDRLPPRKGQDQK